MAVTQRSRAVFCVLCLASVAIVQGRLLKTTTHASQAGLLTADASQHAVIQGPQPTGTTVSGSSLSAAAAQLQEEGVRAASAAAVQQQEDVTAAGWPEPEEEYRDWPEPEDLDEYHGNHFHDYYDDAGYLYDDEEAGVDVSSSLEERLPLDDESDFLSSVYSAIEDYKERFAAASFDAASAGEAGGLAGISVSGRPGDINTGDYIYFLVPTPAPAPALPEACSQARPGAELAPYSASVEVVDAFAASDSNTDVGGMVWALDAATPSYVDGQGRDLGCQATMYGMSWVVEPCLSLHPFVCRVRVDAGGAEPAGAK